MFNFVCDIPFAFFKCPWPFLGAFLVFFAWAVMREEKKIIDK